MDLSGEFSDQFASSQAKLDTFGQLEEELEENKDQ